MPVIPEDMLVMAKILELLKPLSKPQILRIQTWMASVMQEQWKAEIPFALIAKEPTP
jgi:hypothetical protein